MTIIRSAALVSAATLALGASLLAAAPAWADQVATTPTVITIVPSATQAAVGAPVNAEVTVSIPDGTTPDGVLVVNQTQGSDTQQLRSKRIQGSQDIAGAQIDTSNSGDWVISAHFTPTRAIDQSSANASTTILIRNTGASLSFSPGTVVAGHASTAAVQVELPQGSQGAAGTVRLDVGTTAGVATCAPQPDSATSESCTLHLPGSLTAGDLPMNVSWYGSPTTDEADLTGTLHVVAQSATTTTKSSAGSGSSGAGSGSSGAGSAAGGKAAASAVGSGSAGSAATVSKPVAAAAAAGSAPLVPAVGGAPKDAAAASAARTASAVESAQSGVAVPPYSSPASALHTAFQTGALPVIVAIVIVVLLIVAAGLVLIGLSVRRRRSIAAAPAGVEGR